MTTPIYSADVHVQVFVNRAYNEFVFWLQPGDHRGWNLFRPREYVHRLHLQAGPEAYYLKFK